MFVCESCRAVVINRVEHEETHHSGAATCAPLGQREAETGDTTIPTQRGATADDIA